MRRLIDRWKIGALPTAIDKIVPFLSSRLKSLERTLDVLHPAVEHPVAETVARVAATANTAVTATTATAITGCTTTITPEVDMTLLVFGVWDVSCTTFAATHVFFGELFVNGVVQVGQAYWVPTAANARATVCQNWRLVLDSGTAYTIDFRGRTSNVANQWQVGILHTNFHLLQVPLAFKGTT
jgi:hypothetical protein